MKRWFFGCALVLGASLGCTTKPVPGPDKQGAGLVGGAAFGAGSGAVIGAGLTVGTGPGAFVGAGMGAIFGSLHGIAADLLEDEEMREIEEVERLKVQAWVQETLAEHYDRRLSLYPNREIFPADVFFDADKAIMPQCSRILAREIAKRAKNELPWSRILITSYSMSSDPESPFAARINEQRAQEIALQFVKAGVEPRRVSTRAVTLSQPLVTDPNDSPGRYRQAIEFIPLDY